MRRLLLVGLLLGGCRTSDGSRSAPARGESPAQAASDSARADSLLERADRARIQGDASARVWIVEISDFQCPYCKRFHDETYPALVRDFIRTGIARMAYVHLPLQQHPHAFDAAEASTCAGLQGRFWQMHDALFDTQSRWAPLADAASFFASLADSIGVNPGEYRECMRSTLMRRLVNADRARAASAGVTSTPSFFVGDELLRGAAPIADFRAAIERARVRAARPPR